MRYLSFVEQMLDGHLYFLQRNTGVTNNPFTDLFVLNPEGVLANNRHIIDHTAMQGMPSNDCTTEGQSLLVLGFIYAYYATKDRRYLEGAEFYADAYFKYFYAGKPAPDTGDWQCNWICNGKEPFLASWPLDPEFPTHSGFKAIVFNWTNGKIQIPHGAPYWGQFLDAVTFAFDGDLNWPAINASIHAENDWNGAGVKYDIDYIVDYRRRKVSGKGDVLAENYTAEPIGTVALVNKTVNGPHKLNFANAQPVEYGGYMIKRNEIYHNRPLRVPLPAGFEGNASDAELWFYDACWHLYEITKNIKYKKARDAIYRTIESYINIGRDDRFFRQTRMASTPYTDGIAYDYFYPTAAKNTLTYGRDNEGYITVRQTAEAQSTIEQNAINYAIKEGSVLVVNAQSKRLTDNAPAKIDCFLGLSDNVAGQNEKRFRVSLNPAQMLNRFDCSKLIAEVTALGQEAVMAKDSNVAAYGTKKYTFDYQSNFLDGRSDYICNFELNTEDDECIIGFWALTESIRPVRSITYKSPQALKLSIADSANWRWNVTLPASANWITVAIDNTKWVLNGWQPNPGTPPAAPVSLNVEQCKIYPANFTAPFAFQWYCVNEVPPLMGVTSGRITRVFAIRLFSDAKGINARIGDCYVENVRDDMLAYTPGIVPFGNVMSPYSPVYSGWRGLPYPGYQYPFVFIYGDNPRRQLLIENQCRFLRDSQKAYEQKFKVNGPCAAAYIWDRWDNIDYGPPNSWTFGHWGDSAWGGYQPRAFFAAARAYYEMKKIGMTIPNTLTEFIEIYMRYLIDFTKKDGSTPTEFPMDRPAYRPPNDFTAHMSGLWLAGLSMAKLAGLTVPDQEWLMLHIANELAGEFCYQKPDHIMNGGWSPWVGGGMYFGFYTGEVMRGLSLYLLAMNGNTEH